MAVSEALSENAHTDVIFECHKISLLRNMLGVLN